MLFYRYGCKMEKAARISQSTSVDGHAWCCERHKYQVASCRILSRWTGQLALLWDMWDQEPLHSQRWHWKTIQEPKVLPWRLPSSVVSVACLQYETLWLHSLVSSRCCHWQLLDRQWVLGSCCLSNTFFPDFCSARAAEEMVQVLSWQHPP